MHIFVLGRHLGFRSIKHPLTVQDGGIEQIYLAFHSEITPAQQASQATLLQRRREAISRISLYKATTRTFCAKKVKFGPAVHVNRNSYHALNTLKSKSMINQIFKSSRYLSNSAQIMDGLF